MLFPAMRHALIRVTDLSLRGRRLLVPAAALWMGAAGLLGLALVLGCAAEVLEGGLGAALGAVLAPGSLAAPHGASLWHA